MMKAKHCGLRLTKLCKLFTKQNHFMRKKLLSKVLLSMIFMFLGVQAFAQDRTVTGRVTASDDGSGVPGASISIKGTSKGTTSDGDGNYKISAPSSATLVFSSVGFDTQEIVVGSKSQINVALKTDSKLKLPLKCKELHKSKKDCV